MRLGTALVRVTLAALLLLLGTQAALAGELDGKWNFTFYSDEGEHPREIVLKQNGSEVTGKLGKETFSGTFSNGTLTLEGKHYADEAGYSALMTITGKLVDGRLKGTGSWESYDLTFTATKAD